MKLPWSSGVYKDDKRYYPQDRVFCDGSVFASLAEQTGNRPSFTVNPDGTYEVSSGWMLLAPGLSGSSDGTDYTDLANKPRINGVELLGDKTPAELGLAEIGDIPASMSQLENDEGFVKAQEVSSLLGGKVDKVDGKGLSTNDYTTEDKTKVASAVLTYDASWVEEYRASGEAVTEELLDQLAEAVTSGRKILIVKGTDTCQCVANIDSSSSLGKIVNLLAAKYSLSVEFYRLAANRTVYQTTFPLSIDDAINPSSYNTVTNKAISSALADKQNVISDLATIREGASKGATALQSVPSAYRTAAAQDVIDSGKVDKVTGKGLSTNDYTDADKAKVAAALTKHQSLEGYARTAEVEEMIAAAVTAAINTEI